MKIIGISGSKGSGKSHLAKIIKDVELNAFNGKIVRQADFGDRLKDEVAALLSMYHYDRDGLGEWLSMALGSPYKAATILNHINHAPHRNGLSEWLRIDLDDPELKEKHYRMLLQQYGTTYRRKEDPAYFTRIVARKIDDFIKAGVQIVIVPRVSFVNELDTLLDYRDKGHEVYTLKVLGGNNEIDNHPSERESGVFGAFDKVFDNTHKDHGFDHAVREWWNTVRA